MPVYNGGEEIVGNVGAIQRAVASGLPDEQIEVVVVSDGSLDDTGERLLAARADAGIRVIHYDRNLGKGYAVKAGALASHGQWVALVDSDLDLDPASIPEYLHVARAEQLDFAIGSKRHPESVVHYPRSRRVASWCYQQLNRLLFGLDVRDTQVGLKVFSRRVVEDVIPLLLVKQFAFDVELLAVATALGRGRVKELPVRLDYRFTGSALRSSTVLRALLDTVAVFYRLRILRTYQRKRRLLGGLPQRPEAWPLVSVVGSATSALDYPRLEAAASAEEAHGTLLAILRGDARPAGNWVSAAVPYFADPTVAAVVVPTVSPLGGRLGRRVAAAVLESRLGAGSRRSSYLPGNVREVADHAAESIVLRATDYESVSAAGVDADRVVAWLAERGRRTIYTPDASVSAPPPPMLRPQLAATFRHGRARGAAARRSHGGSLSGATARSVLPSAAAAAGAVLLAAGDGARKAGFVLLLAYAAALAASAIHAGVRFGSPAVAVLHPPAVVASQAAYLAGFVRGLIERPKTRAARLEP